MRTNERVVADRCDGESRRRVIGVSGDGGMKHLRKKEGTDRTRVLNPAMLFERMRQMISAYYEAVETKHHDHGSYVFPPRCRFQTVLRSRARSSVHLLSSSWPKMI